MIFLNGQQTDNIASFSPRFQSVISMIEGGMDWLNWAIRDRTSPSVNATQEDQLLEMIQHGLHADDYIRFRTFRANLDKILTLPDADIEQLGIIRKTGNDNDVNLQSLLHRNGMFSYAEISEAVAEIPAISSTRPDLFQALSFEDQLALTDFMQKQAGVDEDLKQQAYVFALNNAANIPDFINLCFFFHILRHQLPGNLIVQTQNSEIQALYRQLLPVSAYLLFTPNAGRVRQEKLLREAVPELARTNKFIGYSTSSSSVLNLVQNINVNDPTDISLQSRIDSYLSSVKNLVGFTPPSAYSLSQDGRLATLSFEKDQAQAHVGVDDAGNVFLLPDTRTNIN
jgi:hypothetical protein